MKIKIKLSEGVILPEYLTEGAAGIDLRANIACSMCIRPMERMLVPTGINIEIPKGYEAQIRPRSDLASRYGITVLNSYGTIDSDFRGEIQVLLINFSKNQFRLRPNDRIAQIVFAKVTKANFEIIIKLGNSNYGSVADISTTDEVTNASKTIANQNFSGWVSVKDGLPEVLETVWISNGKGLTTLGCLIYLCGDGKREPSWCWAVSNGIIYEENGNIVTDCEPSDLDVCFWHKLPAPPIGL
jgi:dUTP pyrophosphatase